MLAEAVWGRSCDGVDTAGTWVTQVVRLPLEPPVRRGVQSKHFPRVSHEAHNYGFRTLDFLPCTVCLLLCVVVFKLCCVVCFTLP